MKTLFECSNYKTYLKQRLDERGARSGLRSDLARALRCQTSYISQVLRGNQHLSLEQACWANDYFSHDEQEGHFFMLLVQKERAGTSDLRSYFQKQVDRILAERNKIKSRLSTTHELTEKDQARYYSRWDYSAVHMALAVPELRREEDLVRTLNLPRARVAEILRFLVQSGLAQKKGDQYLIGAMHLHLDSDSPFIHQHHSNWRLEALRRLETAEAKNLHYSGVYTLARKDYARLRENLMQVVAANLQLVRPSPEEMVVCQMIDLIPLFK